MPFKWIISVIPHKLCELKKTGFFLYALLVRQKLVTEANITCLKIYKYKPPNHFILRDYMRVGSYTW